MKGFRVGVGTQALNTRRSPTTMVRAVYLAAVAAGVDSFWVADHLNSLVPRAIATPRYFGGAKLVPRIDAQLEPWTTLGRLAATNRIGRLRLGVGVTDAGRRNPAVTAQAAATLHLLTRGRAILGIGVGEREGNEPYGVEWTKPVARFEEAVATIRALWESGRGSRPEIWIAAHGPRMLRAAGRYADAWYPQAALRPQDYARGLGRGTRGGIRRRARPDGHHPGGRAVPDHRARPRPGRGRPEFGHRQGVRAQHSRPDVGGPRRRASARPRLLRRTRPPAANARRADGAVIHGSGSRVVDERVLSHRHTAGGRRSSRRMARSRTALPGRNEPQHPAAQPA
jgi:alkanesulfonate monooxygenase SsuD/methylene tetrahydromethanopterin reductase-like flavin-dependent oxidoreductase (luciferase family)